MSLHRHYKTKSRSSYVVSAWSWVISCTDVGADRNTGPPPQVASIAGKKAGMKQGELSGILKELGYAEEQVNVV